MGAYYRYRERGKTPLKKSPLGQQGEKRKENDMVMHECEICGKFHEEKDAYAYWEGADEAEHAKMIYICSESCYEEGVRRGDIAD